MYWCINISKIPLELFKKRLSTAMNIYWMTGLDPLNVAAGLPEKLQNGKQVEAFVQYDRLVYLCHWGWLAALILTCLVVVAVILTNAVLQSKVLGPDILGYVSTMTHDNKFIPVPKGGSGVTGIERTLKLADLKLRLQDVRPDQDIGQIALASVQGERLQKGRKYY